jgi:hypothetical protein
MTARSLAGRAALLHHGEPMGFLDRAKRFLGLGGAGEEENEEIAPPAAPADPRAAKLEKARGRKDRPPLVDLPPSAGQTVEDALAAREAGDKREARRILATIDRGAGLRTVLRAAAALEAGDKEELDSLMPAVAAEAEGYRLWLQVAAALGEGEAQVSMMQHALAAEAPAWALAWTRALSADEAARREGLVDLLFADAPLARTVAARDLGVEGAATDSEASARYAAFAHGRDSIRRFDARLVSDLLELAAGARA